MIVFVHQPEYMPWLGFFDKLARCDTFVIYDDAQYQHGGYHNRNKIRTIQGWEWLTIPIVHNHPQMIKDVKISGKEWVKKHLSMIVHNYEKTPYFREYFPLIEEVLNSNHQLLIDLDMHLIKVFSNILSIESKMIRSSEFPYFGAEKNEKLVSMCRLLRADTYLAGSGGRNYVNGELFSKADVTIQWHAYDHPIYQQKFEGFQPNLSIIDLLFNLGPKAKGTILKGGSVSFSKPLADVDTALTNQVLIL